MMTNEDTDAQTPGWTLDKEFDTPILLVQRGNDKIEQLGSNDELGAIIRMTVSGETYDPQPLQVAMKFLDLEGWEVVGSVRDI